MSVEREEGHREGPLFNCLFQKLHVKVEMYLSLELQGSKSNPRSVDETSCSSLVLMSKKDISSCIVFSEEAV